MLYDIKDNDQRNLKTVRRVTRKRWKMVFKI